MGFGAFSYSGRRDLGRGTRVPGGVGAGVDPLETRILAEFSAVSWTVYFLGLAREDAITEVSGRVSVQADLSGLSNSATQGTSADRPLYDATAVGGGPGITYGGGDHLSTAALDLSAHQAAAQIVTAQDATTAASFMTMFGATEATVGMMGLRCNTPVTDAVRFVATGDVGIVRAGSLGSYPLTAAGVVTGTVDFGLSTNEPEIRHDGSNVSSSRTNANNTGTLGAAHDFTMGARNDGAAPYAGSLGACILAAGSGPISGAVLTAIANVEQLLADALAAGSYA